VENLPTLHTTPNFRSIMFDIKDLHVNIHISETIIINKTQKHTHTKNIIRYELITVLKTLITIIGNLANNSINSKQGTVITNF
jgi:hypothetical protein